MKFSKKRIVRLSIALALSAVCMTAAATRAYWSDTAFYDDAGNMVGEEIIGCVGRPTMEGVRTSHAVELSSGPCFGNCWDDIYCEYPGGL